MTSSDRQTALDRLAPGSIFALRQLLAAERLEQVALESLGIGVAVRQETRDPPSCSARRSAASTSGTLA